MSVAATAFVDPGAGADLVYALQLALGGVFLLSVIAKLRRPAQFRRTVARYEVLPQWMSRPVAIGLTAAEAFLAAAFLTGWLVAIALPLGALMLVAFATASWINLRRGRNVPCGCFGSDEELISARSMARIAFLSVAVVIVAGALLSGGTHAVTVDWLSARGLSALGYAAEIIGLSIILIAIATWALAAPDLVALIRTYSGNRGSRRRENVDHTTVEVS